MNAAFTQRSQAFVTAMGVPAAALLVASVVLLPVVPSAAVIVAYAAFLLLAAQNRFRHNPSVGPLRTPLPWMAALFLVHVIGMAWSANTGFGLFDLQIKLPLFALPLLVVFIDRSKWRGRDLLLFLFALSCALMVLACTVAALVRIAMGSALSPMQEIFSSYWSLALHPSYFALYLSLAIAAWCLLAIHSWLPRVVSIFVLSVLCLGVVLCGSKIGWMLLVPLLFTLLLLRWREDLVRVAVLGMIGFSVAGVCALVVASPYARDRVLEMFRASVEQEHQHTAVTSSEVRWLTWGTAWELFQRAPLIGTGTGDIKDELVKAYEAHGYTGAAVKRLNAHDQYLQTAACLGIVGALLVLAMLLVPLLAGAPRDPLVVLFLLLNGLNWIVESMLEVQAGAVFFSAFAVLLLWKDEASDLRT